MKPASRRRTAPVRNLLRIVPVLAVTSLLSVVHPGNSAEGPPGKQPVLRAVTEPVTALVFAPDGKTLLAGGYAQIRVRSADGRGERRHRVTPQLTRELAFHPSGKWLAVVGGKPGAEGIVEILAWPSGARLRKVADPKDLVNAAAFNPDGTLLATAGADRSVRLYRFEQAGTASPELSPLPLLEGHSGPVLSLAFSPDGKTLLTAGVDRSIRVWDPESGKLLRVFTNHLDTVHALAFAPTAPGGPPPYAASGSEDRTVRVWQPEIGRMVRILRGFEGPVLAVAYSRDRQQLFCADTTGTVRAFDASGDEVLRSWKAHAGWIYRMTVSPDGSRLATGDWSGMVKVWNPATGEPVRQ